VSVSWVTLSGFSVHELQLLGFCKEQIGMSKSKINVGLQTRGQACLLNLVISAKWKIRKKRCKKPQQSCSLSS